MSDVDIIVPTDAESNLIPNTAHLYTGRAKIFVVHGIRGEYCTCGKSITECKQKSGKIQAGKHPITGYSSPYPANEKGVRSWTLASSNEPAVIDKWYAINPYFNLALHAGANNAIIIDFDGPEGAKAFEEIYAAHPEWFVNAAIEKSGGGGYHVIVLQPGTPVEGFNTVYGEVRVGDQYAVIAPSMHYTGHRYEAVKGHNLAEVELTEIHPGLLAYLRGIAKANTPAKTKTSTTGIERVPVEEIDGLIEKYEVREDMAVKIKAVDVADVDRSNMLFHITMYLISKDVLDSDALKILKFTAYNKFRDRGDKEDYWLNETWKKAKDEYTKQEIAKGMKSATAPKEPGPGQDLTKEYPFNDIGNGERFADQHRHEMLWIGEKESWFYKKDGIWREDNVNKAQSLAKQTARSIDSEVEHLDDDDDREDGRAHAGYSQNMAGLNNMIKSARDLLAHEITDFDQDPWMLPCLNGVVNLKTGAFRPFLHTDMFTKVCPVVYDEKAPIPQGWLDFIKDISRKGETERPELEAYHKRVAGYLITGSTGEQCMFLFEGEGNNGKSTYINLLALMFGINDGFVRTISSDIIMARKFDGSPEELAQLKGARIVITSETKKGRRMNVERVKGIAGSDYIYCCFKYGHYFTYKPEFKLILATNSAPIVDDESEGIWRKIRRVPFDHVVPKDNRVKDYENTLFRNAPGILRWFVEGCLEWQNGGLKEPACVIKATEAYRNEMDSLKKFVENCCEIRVSKDCAFKETNKRLYSEYVNYCDQLGLYCTPKRDMLARLKNEYKLEDCDIRESKTKHDKGLKYIKIKEIQDNDTSPNDKENKNGKQEGKSTNPPISTNNAEKSPIREKFESQGKIVDNSGLVDTPTPQPIVSIPQDERVQGILDTIKYLSTENVRLGYCRGATREQIIEVRTTIPEPPETTNTILDSLLERGVIMQHPSFPNYLTLANGGNL